jgi:pyruvate/2-oxoglutarate/acetoin dehydrogenase E1 component
MKYFDALQQTMEWLGKQEDTIFIGQTVCVPGTFMHGTLDKVSIDKRLEFPVCESFQMQFSIGVALTGKTVISVYPRQNFLLLATADMANMLDKIVDISYGELNPHILIRVASGPDYPVHPGHQHIGNYADAFRILFKNIPVYELNKADEIQDIYEAAYNRRGPTLLIEHGNMYND